MVLAIVVNAPSLKLGLFGDDYAHRRFILAHLDGRAQHVPWWNMFDARPVAGTSTFEMGTFFGKLPWWASQHFSFALLRPLSTASQYIDYLLWPNTPPAMHAHNVALLCVALWVAGDLYWSLFQARIAAWLALALLSIDGASTICTAWIASRNTLLTDVFILLTLWSYARAHRLAAPIFLLCAHACSEGAIIAWAYLFAYAACLDERPWSQKWRNMLPMVCVTSAWLAFSGWLGYGVRGSGTYVDPRGGLNLFAQAVVERLPRLIEIQFGLTRDYARALAPERVSLALVLALAYLCTLGLGALLYARRSRLVRFFALASIGALVPQCAAGAFERVLLLSAFAAHGLIVAVGVELLASARQSAHGILRPASIAFAVGTVWIHGLLALEIPPGSEAYGKMYEASILRAVASLPPSPQDARIVALNFPDYLRSELIELYRRERFPPGPERLEFIMISPRPVRVARTARDAIEIDAGDRALIDPSTLLVRQSRERFRVGQRFDLGYLSLEVVGVTADGRPGRVRLQGDFDGKGFLWVRWSSRRRSFEPVTLPLVGESGWLDS